MAARRVDTEAAFQSWVRTTAKRCGWVAYHTHDSRRSDKGFPDLVLVRGTTMLAVELKTAEGKVSAEQIEWLRRLGRVTSVRVAVWRPADREGILDALAHL